MANHENRKCFIITPVGDDKSEVREKAEGVIDVIKPKLKEHGFEAIVPHKMAEMGSITQQILECILNSDLVIANLTGLNPNVMYELAVRHATGLPIITIAETGTKLPFDITTERTIFYPNDLRGGKIILERLEKAIESIDFTNSVSDNPIFRAKQSFKMRENASNDNEVYILDQLNNISRKLDAVISNKKTRMLDGILREEGKGYIDLDSNSFLNGLYPWNIENPKKVFFETKQNNNEDIIDGVN